MLGLMKAQMVKNAVIVPVGAKGGFVLKRPPAGDDRDALLAEVETCYRTFISGMLDLTDNIEGNEIEPPPNVVRYDEDDSLLRVVAADKGRRRLRRGQRRGEAVRLGSATRSRRAARAVTTKARWASPRAAPGSRSSVTSARPATT